MLGGRPSREAFIFVGGLATCACGSPGSTGPGGPTPPAYEAPHPPLPQIVSLGGPVMKAPRLISMMFQGDPDAAAKSSFVSQLAGSAYFTDAVAEYGVGPLSASPALQFDEQPPASLADADVQAWLATKILQNPAPAQPDANSVYVIFYPSTTTITSSAGVLCDTVGGYHGDFTLPGGKTVTYAVIPDCANATLDTLTANASHEIIEAATDPLSEVQAAFAQFDEDHIGWQFLAGGELGDACAVFTSPWVHVPGIDGIVQRVWSNEAAASGRDPCEPLGASPYFNSAPVLNDAITAVDPAGNTFATRGVHIPVGQSRTIELDLFSEAPLPGPWGVTVDDSTPRAASGAYPFLSFVFGPECDATGSFDGGPAYSCEGTNGDKIHLTITALQEAPNKTAIFTIQNYIEQPTSTLWVPAPPGSDAAGLPAVLSGVSIQTAWIGLVAN